MWEKKLNVLWIVLFFALAYFLGFFGTEYRLFLGTLFVAMVLKFLNELIEESKFKKFFEAAFYCSLISLAGAILDISFESLKLYTFVHVPFVFTGLFLAFLFVLMGSVLMVLKKLV